MFDCRDADLPAFHAVDMDAAHPAALRDSAADAAFGPLSDADVDLIKGGHPPPAIAARAVPVAPQAASPADRPAALTLGGTERVGAAGGTDRVQPAPHLPGASAALQASRPRQRIYRVPARRRPRVAPSQPRPPVDEGATATPAAASNPHRQQDAVRKMSMKRRGVRRSDGAAGKPTAADGLTAPPQAPSQGPAPKRRRYPKLMTDVAGLPPVGAKPLGDASAASGERPEQNVTPAPPTAETWDVGTGDTTDAKQRAQLERRFALVKHFELQKVATGAVQRSSIKMNLRGRNRLESHLSNASAIGWRAVKLCIGILSLDGRLTSPQEGARKAALYSMNNEQLRTVEALMLRVSSRDGAANWSLLFKLYDALALEEEQ
jgi:hypothetical protein